jgi:hypothetical protein
MTIRMRMKGARSSIPILVGNNRDILYVTGSTRAYMIRTSGFIGFGLIQDKTALIMMTHI